MIQCQIFALSWQNYRKGRSFLKMVVSAVIGYLQIGILLFCRKIILIPIFHFNTDLIRRIRHFKNKFIYHIQFQFQGSSF